MSRWGSSVRRCRARAGRWRALVAGFTLPMGCVATDSEAPAQARLCTARAAPNVGSGSVVMISADLGEYGTLRCSGALVAPTLVLTSRLCLGLPSEVQALVLDPPVTTEETRAGERGLYGVYVDYVSGCSSDAGWRAIEDGSFSSRLGDDIEQTSLLVSVVEPDASVRSMSTVRDVFAAVTESRCDNYLAILALDVALEPTPVPVRMKETASVGDRVQLSGIWSMQSRPRPHTVAATIEAITGGLGSATAPPLSAQLSTQVCDFEAGGPVIAEDTGALIGIVATPTGTECGDPLGRTVATRVAPFRQLLVDAVLETGESLQVEAQPEEPVLAELPPCGGG